MGLGTAMYVYFLKDSPLRQIFLDSRFSPWFLTLQS